MRGSLLWGAILAGAGAVVAGGWVPGSHAWALGPRIGIATLLIVLGLTVASLAMVPWLMRRSKAAAQTGGCPVGATCECGHFNFKPRQACRQCGRATTYAT